MSQKVSYSAQVPNSKKPGSTHIYRNPKAKDALIFQPSKDVFTIQDAFLKSCEKNGNNKCLGTQAPDGKSYNWKTYSQVKEQAEKLGSGILSMNLAPQTEEMPGKPMRLIGVYSRNREEWLTLDIANVIYGAVIIPLYDTLGPETISYVIGHSGIESMFIEKSVLKNLWKAGELHKLKTVIQFENDISEEDKKAAADKGIQIITYQSVIEEGAKKIQPKVEVKPKDCFTFSYTSGTTGDPKGAMISHENLVAVMVGSEYSSVALFPTDVHLSYLPLPHILERLVVITLLYYGAAIGFYGGDVLKLKDDLALLKPTLFVSVPRLYNKFYAKIKGNMDAATGCKKCLVGKALAAKRQGLADNASYTNGLWDALVFKKTKAVLGGNVTRMITGSAPISGEVINFMRIAMCCPFIEGYGQTESTGASFACDSKDPNTGHVGGPIVALEYKLEDVPEMGCTSEDKDKETGQPAPRGEICVRGHTIFLGYYKNEEKTKEAIDEDGWLHTGDVGTILPNGALKIIDRKKNIFKLSQGEYVAPEKVENVYLRARGVAEVFVHGDSLQNYAVAIIVPDPEVIKAIAKENDVKDGSVEELCKNEKIQAAYLKNVSTLGKQEGLKGFEQAKRIHLEPVSMAEQNCMTNTMKLQRHNARNVFKPQIDAMYALGDPQPQAQKA